MTRRRFLAALLAVPLAIAVPVHASFDDGIAAFLRGDYAAAWEAWRGPAEAGHAQSAFNLGRMCELGQGVTRDDGAAAAWFRIAAERGHPEAQRSLGQIYLERRGGLDDRTEALMWLTLARRAMAAGSPAERLTLLQLERLRADMTATEIAAGEQRADGFVPRRD